MEVRIFSLICALLFAGSAISQELGWGSDNPGGTGGQIVRVTNLNAAGTGSLKAALEVTTPRTIVFETSGTIVLTDWLTIRHPFVTVAGQSAPNPGITIRGAGIRVMTHDAIIQHLRIRIGDGPGPSPDSRDGIEILANNQDCYNIWVDHCSVSWGIDENFSIYNPNNTRFARNIAVTYCINSEALMEGHPNNDHRSDGTLIGSSSAGSEQTRIVLARNLSAFNNARNPTAQGFNLIVANQLTVAWGGKHWLPRSEGSVQRHKSAWLNNVSIPGGHTNMNGPLIEIDPGFNGELFLEGNDLPPIRLFNVQNPPVTNVRPEMPVGFVVLPTDSVYEHVLQKAGARPLDRDAVDTRIVEQIRNNTGRLIDSQNDVNGWPPLAVNTRLFVPETNVKAQLDRMADELEGEYIVSWAEMFNPVNGAVYVNYFPVEVHASTNAQYLLVETGREAFMIPASVVGDTVYFTGSFTLRTNTPLKTVTLTVFFADGSTKAFNPVSFYLFRTQSTL